MTALPRPKVPPVGVDVGVSEEPADRPPGALEPVEESVEVGGADEPSRRLEWVSGGLLAFFVADLLVVRLTWPPATTFDADLLRDTHTLALTHPWVVHGATWLSVAGSLVFRWTVIGALGLVLWRKGMPRAAVFVVAVEVLGTALNNLIKLGVDRIRPSFEVPVATASGASFPSGHAMNSMICYSLVASALVFSGLVPGERWARVTAGLVLALPVAIGVSRVLLGVHFPTDVLGGWALGLAWVGGATALFRPWRRDPEGQRRLLTAPRSAA